MDIVATNGRVVNRVPLAPPVFSLGPLLQFQSTGGASGTHEVNAGADALVPARYLLEVRFLFTFILFHCLAEHPAESADETGFDKGDHEQ